MSIIPRNAADIDIYYDCQGQGPPLLFIHGLGSSTQDWQHQVAFFSDQYQVITFDLRGHGRSSRPPGPYSIPLFAADTIALLRWLKLAPAHVVGLSLGGCIAFQVALDAPELVRSLTVVNSGPEVPLRSLKDVWRVATGFLKRQLVIRLRGMQKLGESLAKNLLPGPEHAAARRTLIECWAQNDRRAYLAAMSAFRGWAVTDRLGEIRCPVLVMAAEHDYTPLSFKAGYAACLPQAELVVVEDSRHFTPLEKPDAFNRALANFLQRQDL